MTNTPLKESKHSAADSTHRLDSLGKRALITGGGSGLGAAISLALAKSGADVAVHYSSSEKGARETVENIRQAGRRARAFQATFTLPENAGKLVDAATDWLGGLDILVNNAALDPGFRKLADSDTEFVRQLMAVNVEAPLSAIRAAAPPLQQNVDGGSIVNIGSIQSTHSIEGHAAYAATKGALDAMTRQLAVELGPDHIRVNSVNPGFICVPRTVAACSEQELAHRARRVPLQRLGVPDDVADVVVMLCTAACRYLSGQILVVDGASICQLPTHAGACRKRDDDSP